MSHFVTYQCNVSNLEYVKKSLEEMGFGYRENVEIRDYYGQTIPARLAVVKEEDKLLPLGWIEGEKGLELKGDWYMLPFAQDEFINKVSQLHTKYQILDACAENRWNVDQDDIVVNDKGEIEILATQFA